MRALKLYTTSACHLCELAEALVLPELAKYELSLELVEISDSDELMARYGVRIPVLGVEGQEDELGWPFDREMFVKWVVLPC